MDLSKRARVMARSKKLGHCICDPRKNCPCDVFLRQDICPCAGERVPEATGDAAVPPLTTLVRNAGCASKIPAADLARILSRLPAVKDPRLLVGLASADDAGVIQIAPDLCLVQTVDVFTPCVDDPYLFGRIAACNSLSDVYAMGGEPVTALSIIGYPIHTLGDETMYRMLKGGMDTLAEAGVLLVGGHSINDPEIKFGFAVTGTIRPDRIIANAGAQPGDVLVLTKPIGTGIIAFAAQVGRASEAALQAAGESMSTLNRAAAEAMAAAGAHAATDVTGFGLLGHLSHIVRESGVIAELDWQAVPLLPGVREFAAQGVIPGAVERNREFAGPVVSVASGVPEQAVDILYDAQTSGGLLIAVPQDRLADLLDRLRCGGVAHAAVVGRIVAKGPGRISIVSGSPQAAPAVAAKPCCSAPAPAAPAKSPCCASAAPEPAKSSCCSGASAPTAAVPAEAAFKDFMGKAFAPAALDAVQKELTTIALSVAVQCDSCLDIHLAKARAMGISDDKIAEAAWMGVAFGGCKAMMFWERKRRNGV